MRNDFKPVHLKQANRKLDTHVLSSADYQKQDDVHEEVSVKNSLWKKFLGLFKTNPSELPEDLYR